MNINTAFYRDYQQYGTNGNQRIIQSSNHLYGIHNLNDNVAMTENDGTAYGNDNYRNATKVTYYGETRYTDLSKLLYMPNGYIQGSISDENDTDFYSLSLKGILGKEDKKINIALESDNAEAYKMTIYDQYGNQVAMGSRDENGHLSASLDSIPFDMNQYYIKVEGNSGEVIQDNQYQIKMNIQKKDDINTGSRSKIYDYAAELKRKSQAKEDISGSVNDIEEFRKEEKDKYQAFVDSAHDIQNNEFLKNDKVESSIEELLDKERKGETLLDSENTYLRINANLFEYEQAKAQGKIKVIGDDIKKILEENGIQNIEDISVTRNEDGEFIVNGIDNLQQKKAIEDQINEKYKDQLYSLYMQGSSQTTGMSDKQYSAFIKKQEINDYLYKVSGGKVSCDDLKLNGEKITGLPDNISSVVNEPGSNYKYSEIRDTIIEIKQYEQSQGKKLDSAECKFVFNNGSLQMV